MQDVRILNKIFRSLINPLFMLKFSYISIVLWVCIDASFSTTYLYFFIFSPFKMLLLFRIVLFFLIVIYEFFMFSFLFW